MGFYGTLVASETYHTGQGNTAWAAATDAAKNIALLRGSEWIDRSFKSSFPGWKTEARDQIREWPRSPAMDVEGNAIDSDTVPTEVIESSYEAALRELATPGQLSPDYDPAKQLKRSRVGEIDVTNTAGHGPESVRKTIMIIEGIIAPVLTGSGATSNLGGRVVRV